MNYRSDAKTLFKFLAGEVVISIGIALITLLIAFFISMFAALGGASEQHTDFFKSFLTIGPFFAPISVSIVFFLIALKRFRPLHIFFLFSLNILVSSLILLSFWKLLELNVKSGEQRLYNREEDLYTNLKTNVDLNITNIVVEKSATGSGYNININYDLTIRNQPVPFGYINFILEDANGDPVEYSGEDAVTIAPYNTRRRIVFNEKNSQNISRSIFDTRNGSFKLQPNTYEFTDKYENWIKDPDKVVSYFYSIRKSALKYEEDLVLRVALSDKSIEIIRTSD